MALCRAGRTGACTPFFCAFQDWHMHSGCMQQHFLYQEDNSFALKSARKIGLMGYLGSCAAWEGCCGHLVKQVVSPVSRRLRGKSHCRPVLDETNLPEVTACGLNMPCPDLLTPQRAAGAIWTWAPGQPYDANWSQEWQAGWMQYLLQPWRPLHRILGLRVRLVKILCRGQVPGHLTQPAGCSCCCSSCCVHRYDQI